MSYNLRFAFTAGLNKAVTIKKGWKDRIINQISDTEQTLGIEREQYLKNPPHWKHNTYIGIEDDVLCKVAMEHNSEVDRFYIMMDECSRKAPDQGEKLTNKEFKAFLPGLRKIVVEPHRWTADYYEDRMQVLYDVMRGRPSEGITFDSKALTVDQAKGVIILFSEFLDTHDTRLDVPKGHDDLRRLDNGEYEWCEKCGAITYEDSLYCSTRKCPLIAKRKEYDQD